MIQKLTFSLLVVSFKIYSYQNISMTSMLSKSNIRPLLFYREFYLFIFRPYDIITTLIYVLLDKFWPGFVTTKCLFHRPHNDVDSLNDL